jgi:hypothetical protein
MRHQSSVDLDAPADVVRPHVADLSRYRAWMPLIHEVEPVDESTWRVELRAKVGVFARSKRLTMRRTVATGDEIVFERHEDDGRTHAAWVMKVRIAPRPGGCTVTIELTYGGNLWTAGVLDKILAHQVEVGRKNLAALVAHSG